MAVNKKFRVVKLMGGFGNQMFQYAFAKLLEKFSGEKVLFDVKYFEEMKKNEVGSTGFASNGLPLRELEINIFPNVSVEIASDEQINEARKLNTPKFVYNFFKMLKLTKWTKLPRERSAFSYEKDFLKIKEGYFEGYFQNENYYNDYLEEIKETFKLPEIREEDNYNKEISEKIKSAENPVFIHLRRSEYLNLGFGISDNYYKKAVEYIKERIENPKFFVFCAEDPEYVQNEFNIGVDFELVGVENKTRETFFENMRHMKECKHAILANSSYSWWAGYLMDNKDKIVIAPTPWLEGSDQVICKNWVKIPAH